MQRLPPRQRVALLFVDVMGWAVAEVATVLGTSPAAINSALQRARETMRSQAAAGSDSAVEPGERSLVDRYIRAWENRDLDRFVDLRKEDAIYSMPPRPQWSSAEVRSGASSAKSGPPTPSSASSKRTPTEVRPSVSTRPHASDRPRAFTRCKSSPSSATASPPSMPSCNVVQGDHARPTTWNAKRSDRSAAGRRLSRADHALSADALSDRESGGQAHGGAGAGVIVIHTPEPARLCLPMVGGMGPAWAAMEALSRNLSAEFASKGVRSVVLRSTGLPETKTIEVVFGLHAKAIGIPLVQFLAIVESMTHRKRSSTLAEVANAAVFVASDAGSGLTGTVVNLTGGMIVD